MYDKIEDFLFEHSKGVLLVILACLMTLGTSLILIVPRAKSINNYNQIIEDVGGVEYIKNNIPSDSSSEDVFARAENIDNITETRYIDTEEYKAKQSELNKKAQRYSELNTDLMLTINKNISDYFISFTEYSMLQTSVNLEKLKDFVTDDYFENTLKKQEVKEGVYQVLYARFADFDKDTVLAYVEIKGSDNSYIMSYVDDVNKGWVISDIRTI